MGYNVYLTPKDLKRNRHTTSMGCFASLPGHPGFNKDNGEVYISLARCFSDDVSNPTWVRLMAQFERIRKDMPVDIWGQFPDRLEILQEFGAIQVCAGDPPQLVHLLFSPFRHYVERGTYCCDMFDTFADRDAWVANLYAACVMSPALFETECQAATGWHQSYCTGFYPMRGDLGGTGSLRRLAFADPANWGLVKERPTIDREYSMPYPDRYTDALGLLLEEHGLQLHTATHERAYLNATLPEKHELGFTRIELLQSRILAACEQLRQGEAA